MKIEHLEVYLSDIDIPSVLPDDVIRAAIIAEVRETALNEIRRFTRETTQDCIALVRQDLQHRIKGRVGPRIDAIFQEVVDAIDKMPDDELFNVATTSRSA